MSWLKKIFSSREQEQRAARIKILSFHKVYFELLISQGKPKKIRLVNLSTNGIGLQKDKDPSWQAQGQKIAGHLVIHERRYPITLEVKHVTGTTVGCQMTQKDLNVERAIEEYLLYEITGIGLQPVRDDILKPQHDGHPIWFVDGHKNELFAVEKNGVVVRFHMTFLGNHIAWKKGDVLRVGYIVEPKSSDEPGYKPSDQIRFDADIPKEMGRMAFRFVAGIEGLQEQLRKQIELQLNPIYPQVEQEV